MTTATLLKKLNKEVRDLKGEVSEIKQALLMAVVDKEGSYQDGFVKKVKRREREKAQFTYKDRDSFLKHAREKRSHV
jgi:GH24 family phage-related lysozyme (muramidase)